MNNLSIIEWISFLPAIGSLAAAIIALFTLLELASQRKQNAKPDIVPTENYFNGYFDNPFTCRWQKKGEKKSKRSNDLEIILYNLGNGAAKNIKLKWDFNYKLFVNELAAINEEYATSLKVLIENNMLRFELDEDTGLIVNIKPDLEDSLDYILPVNINETGTKVSLPLSYFSLVANYFYLRFNHVHSDLKINLMTLKLNLSYEDIQGNTYHDKYEFTATPVYFSGDPDPEFNCRLSYKKL